MQHPCFVDERTVLAPDAAAHTKSKAKGYQITFMKEEEQRNEPSAMH